MGSVNTYPSAPITNRSEISKSKLKAFRTRNQGLIMVIVISLVVHLVGLIILGGMTIYNVSSQEDAEFDTPPRPPEQPIEKVKIRIARDMKKSSPLRQVVQVQNIADMNPMDIALPNIKSTDRVGFAKSKYAGGLSMMVGLPSISFFGLESSASTIVFVVDVSGSMILGGRGEDGFKKVADEILRVIKGIEESGSSVRFNIIGFAGQVDKLNGRLIEANDQNLKRAERWLKSNDPAKALSKFDNLKSIKWENYRDAYHKGTRADLGLKAAFAMNPEQIIFLSDGEPTTVNGSDVLKIVNELQSGRDPSVQISTISYLSKNGQNFLKSLASQNNGNFQIIN
ncbi:VWA domain-containing protein [Rubellicoccus peritrichatus]|uniref:VWA domain-containing protein n=1 Tax=Rubellicoccus peritrichatus TaxID=3080537 RepID=A0AAQ3QRR8_9BACT|nr:VWA domain-containing protein [Puniceicoccus sp. CR14]WOO41558.1 VWA domain-containing protein [Puniceicoccus sp. CR14]